MANVFSVLGILWMTASAVAAPPPFDSTRILDADVILRPEFIRGPYFSVRRDVPTRGGLNRYTIDSPFGVFTADGNTALLLRLREIQAIAKLREISKGKEYGEALGRAATGPLKIAESVVKHPVDTAGGVFKGLWKTVNGAGQQIKEVGQGRKQSAYEDSTPEDLIGFSAAKRDIALKLGVDPYSTNKVLQEDLKKIAWAAYGGKMTFAGALMPIGGVAGITLQGVQAGGQSLAALHDLSPADLRLRNLKILLAMGTGRDLANKFLNNPNLSPTHQTIIVDCMQRIGGVPGTDKFVRIAAGSGDETDALRYTRSAQLLAAIVRTRPIDLLSNYKGLPLALTRGGVLVVPLEWDYAMWTHESQRFLSALKSGRIGDRRFHAIHVYLTGEASPNAKAAAAQNNISLTMKSLPGPLR